LAAGANPTVRDSVGKQPLHLAAMLQDLEGSKLLLTNPAVDVRAKDDHGTTPLHLAANNGAIELCKLLLQKDPAHIDGLDAEGRTALHFACAFGHIEIVKVLLANTPPPSLVAVDLHGETPLHAVWLGDSPVPAIEDLILDSAAGRALKDDLLKMKDKDGQTVGDLKRMALRPVSEEKRKLEDLVELEVEPTEALPKEEPEDVDETVFDCKVHDGPQFRGFLCEHLFKAAKPGVGWHESDQDVLAWCQTCEDTLTIGEIIFHRQCSLCWVAVKDRINIIKADKRKGQQETDSASKRVKK